MTLESEQPMVSMSRERRATGRRAAAARRAAVIAGAVVSCAAFGGCVSTPARPTEPGAPVSENLYEGQPETVYATEFPVESAADARSRAAQALNDGDPDRALYFYVQAVEIEPRDAESLYMIGRLHERKGNRRQAARGYAGAVEVDAEHAPALEGLGVAHFEARDTESAREMLERSVAADPRRWRAHNVLGVIADTSGRFDAAVEHYSAALAIRPDEALLLNNRGYSSYMAGDYRAAEADFRAALDADPDYERAWQNLGLVYARQRQYGMALQALSRVMERHAAANDVGYVAMLDGDYDAAEKLFTEAKRIAPRYYQMADENLAQLRSRRGADSASAEAHFGAARRVPEDAAGPLAPEARAR